MFGDKIFSEHGASLFEYVLLVAVLTLLALMGVRAVGTGAQDSINRVSQELTVQGGDCDDPAVCGGDGDDRDE